MIDHFPESKEEEATAIGKFEQLFQAADSARRLREDDWLRWYKIHHNYVDAEKNKEDNWRTKIGIPALFYVVETVAPRLVAQLPEALVEPMSEYDVQGAEKMKQAIDWAADVSELYINMVAQMKDALNYGTGIMKTLADEKTAVEQVPEIQYEDVPIQVPVIDPETQQPMIGMNNEQMTEEQVYKKPVGVKMVPKDYTYYRGPFGEAIDIFNFWFAPDARSMEDARWVIQRSFISKEDFEKLVAQGAYRKSEYLSDGDFYAQVDDPMFRKYNAIGLGGSRNNDPAIDSVELMEIWSKGPGSPRKVCIANRKAVVSAEPNPFNHGEHPYMAIVDHYVQHEPYGIGEMQLLEGLQDGINMLTSSRIDAVKLALNLMFFVDEDALVNPSDLRIRPGGRIRVRNRYGLPLNQIVDKVELGDATQGSYVEVDKMYETLERMSGVAGPPGPEDAARYRTATGVMSIDEGMASRFAHKLKMMELTGMERMFRHYGILLQQYMDEPMSRQLFKDGSWQFVPIEPAEIQGRFSYKIASESSAMSETNRREQALLMYHELSQSPYVNPTVPLEEVLKAHGIKDISRWIAPPEQQFQMLLQQIGPDAAIQMIEQMMQAQQQPAQEGAPVG